MAGPCSQHCPSLALPISVVSPPFWNASWFSEVPSRKKYGHASWHQEAKACFCSTFVHCCKLPLLTSAWRADIMIPGWFQCSCALDSEVSNQISSIIFKPCQPTNQEPEVSGFILAYYPRVEVLRSPPYHEPTLNSFCFLWKCHIRWLVSLRYLVVKTWPCKWSRNCPHPSCMTCRWNASHGCRLCRAVLICTTRGESWAYVPGHFCSPLPTHLLHFSVRCPVRRAALSLTILLIHFLALCHVQLMPRELACVLPRPDYSSHSSQERGWPPSYSHLGFLHIAWKSILSRTRSSLSAFQSLLPLSLSWNLSLFYISVHYL